MNRGAQDVKLTLSEYLCPVGDCMLWRPQSTIRKDPIPRAQAGRGRSTASRECSPPPRIRRVTQPSNFPADSPGRRLLTSVPPPKRTDAGQARVQSAGGILRCSSPATRSMHKKPSFGQQSACAVDVGEERSFTHVTGRLACNLSTQGTPSAER
ncbi:hypothetical protein C8Q78DRAFT_743655 [Trametes maxima]|nr:hypothetical protein C8Q78DRAFT_743655 [Trametes maxima]